MTKNNLVCCRYCNRNEMQLEEDVFKDELGEEIRLYWYDCQFCGTRTPLSESPELALEYATHGYN